MNHSLCSAPAKGSADQSLDCGVSAPPVPVLTAAPYAEAADAGDQAVETTDPLELAGMPDAMAQQLSHGSQWLASSLSSQLRKLMGVQSTSKSSPRGSMHRKLLNDSGAQTTSDFPLSYQLLLQLNGSSGNDYAVLLSNPATTLNNMIAANFKLAMERAVARLMPRRRPLGEPGAKVLPPVVKQVKFGSPVVMNMTMRLNVVAAMKAASQHTGLPPAELMAAVDAAMTGGHALKMELDDSRVTSTYAVANVTVQPSSDNKGNIASVEAFLSNLRPVQRGGACLTFLWLHSSSSLSFLWQLGLQLG